MADHSSPENLKAVQYEYPFENRLAVRILSKERLVCVDFPAHVHNIDRALETIDGIRGVFKAYKDENKRLEMRWRKDDIYCKPMYGDRLNTTNLLLSVKRRRKPSSHEGQYEYSVAIKGFIIATYHFNAMADYQYLPVERRGDGSCRNLLPDLHLTGLTGREEFLSRDVPLFMPPMIFSRIDTPVEYLYRPDKVMNRSAQKGLEHLPPHLIGTGRQKRTIYTIFKTFDEDTPIGPPEGAESFLQAKLKNTNLLQLVQRLFEERLIWSKNGIRCNMPAKYHPRLKYVLPLVAYYFCNGPWRTLWVKFGYDPRKDKNAKMYQILDFRLRQRGAAEKLEIGGKRSAFDYKLPTVKSRSQMKIPKIHTSTLGAEGMDQSDKSQTLESTYMFEPDVLPPYRQMFYQLCDVHEEQIQKLLHQNDGQESVCTEREGWLEPDVHDKSREILFKHVDNILGRQLFPIMDPGTRRGRRIVNKIRGLLDAPEDSEDDSEVYPVVVDTGAVEEEVNEMETEMLDCI
ncbi:general transcription factor 3C polypeptide 5-like [Haliotis cracherodii]|uniref:general transcription factor 3C polypeptide 5-like n=1 Tax=Haliotis cracherodii TaxID=6455 RepID=UPI0039E869FF